jgi:hypothetical protein
MNLRFQKTAENFTVQAFVAKLVVEAFNVAVLPRCTRLNVNGLDLILLQPVLDRVGDELRTVVTPDVLRGAVALDSAFNDSNDIDRADRPRNVHGQAFTRELTDQSKNAKACSILRLVLHEVPAPDVVRMGRTLTLSRGKARPPRLSLLLSNLQSVMSAHSLHPLWINHLALAPGHYSDPTVAIPRMILAAPDGSFARSSAAPG